MCIANHSQLSHVQTGVRAGRVQAKTSSTSSNGRNGNVAFCSHVLPQLAKPKKLQIKHRSPPNFHALASLACLCNSPTPLSRHYHSRCCCPGGQQHLPSSAAAAAAPHASKCSGAVPDSQLSKAHHRARIPPFADSLKQRAASRACGVVLSAGRPSVCVSGQSHTLAHSRQLLCSTHGSTAAVTSHCCCVLASCALDAFACAGP